MNNKVADPNHIIQESDFIEHFIHLHEPPFKKSLITIVHNDEKILGVSKPSGIPVKSYFHFRFIQQENIVILV